MILRSPMLLLTTVLALTLAGCDSAPAPQTSESTTADRPTSAGHGAVMGASEVKEPQRHLVAIDAAGKASMLDLLSGSDSPLDPVTPPSSVTSDGRYVFATNSTGVDILDSGVWTWDHGDHSHFYRGKSAQIGTVPGRGTATVAFGPLSTAGTTGLFFPDTGDAVLLDNAALSDGTVSESLRISGTPHAGIMAPLGNGSVVTQASGEGIAESLRAMDSTGKELTTAECPAAAGTITTRVGLVIGCADGAVLAMSEGQSPSFEHIPYPDGAAAPATKFNARKGQPTVAGIGADKGVWLLNTRQKSWEWLPTATPVIAAATVDDAAGHVVVVGADGRVSVYAQGDKEPLATTEPLLSKTLASPELAEHVQLTVDGERAYLNAPEEGVVYEIAYADGARLARTLSLPTQPVHLVETGR